jgi:HEAT repeat protein
MSRFLVAALLLVLVAGGSNAIAGNTLQKQPPPDFEGIKALKHPDADVRFSAAQMLIYLPPATAKFAVQAVNEQLKEEKVSWVRVKLVEAVWHIEKPPVKTLLPTLLEALQDEKSEVARANACNVIGQFGAQAKPAVPALSKALSDKDATVRAEAALALGEIGVGAKAAIPALLDSLKTDEIHFAEPFVLASLGKMGEAAVPALKEALTAKQYRLRRGAVYALALIGPPAASTVGSLGALLTAPESDLRGLAARALGKIGKDAKPLLPEVAKLLDDASGPVRIQAAVALWEIDGDLSGKPALVGALKGPNVRVREQACRACAEVGGARVVPITTLTDRLKDESPSVRKLAAEALGMAAANGQAAVPDLRSTLQDKDGLVRVSAALALWRLDNKAADVVHMLAKWAAAKEVENERTRREAAAALGEIGPDARPAIGVLTQVFRDKEDNIEVRRAAALALRKIEIKAIPKN